MLTKVSEWSKSDGASHYLCNGSEKKNEERGGIGKKKDWNYCTKKKKKTPSNRENQAYKSQRQSTLVALSLHECTNASAAAITPSFLAMHFRNIFFFFPFCLSFLPADREKQKPKILLSFVTGIVFLFSFPIFHSHWCFVIQGTIFLSLIQCTNKKKRKWKKKKKKIGKPNKCLLWLACYFCFPFPFCFLLDVLSTNAQCSCLSFDATVFISVIQCRNKKQRRWRKKKSEKKKTDVREKNKKTTARSIPVWSPTTVLTAPSPA